MRKIEEQMIQAIQTMQKQAYKQWHADLQWNSSNTQVTCRKREDGEIVTTVYLHGNMIAQFSSGECGFKMCGWPTPTTKSRINALAQAFGRDGVYTKKGKHYSGSKEVNAYDWF